MRYIKKTSSLPIIFRFVACCLFDCCFCACDDARGCSFEFLSCAVRFCAHKISCRRSYLPPLSPCTLHLAPLTPYAVPPPGHVDKFTDLMVKDTVTGESLRADKLLEDIIDDLLEKNPNIPKVQSRRAFTFITCLGVCRLSVRSACEVPRRCIAYI